MENTKDEIESKEIKAKDNTKYPIAFLTSSNFVFMKSETKVSADGTPRYVPNPNSDATYCIQDCLKDYTPIYSKKELENYQK
jgi:hypothetical protein